MPKVSVLCGQAVGAAYSAMGSKAVGADAVYAWPKAYIAPINAEAAVRILEKEEIRAGKPVAELAKFYEENNDALAAAEEGLCDDGIEPGDPPDDRRRAGDAHGQTRGRSAPQARQPSAVRKRNRIKIK